MTTNRAHLTAAFFCERPLLEQDGVMSAIRIFDRIFVPQLEQSEPPKAPVPLTLVLMFKSGNYSGPASVKISPVPPSGKKPSKEIEQKLELPNQPNGGANLLANISFAPKEEGVYWFDIYFNGELITRTPLDVQILPQQQQKN